MNEQGVEPRRCLCGCGAEVGENAQWLQGHAARGKKKEADTEAMIEQACQIVLDFVATLDAQWAKRIAVARDEKGWSARQFCGAMIGAQLDAGKHLSAPSHQYFEPGVRYFAEKVCPECEKSFKPKIAGQLYCSEECGLSVARKRKAAKDEETRQQRTKQQNQGADAAQNFANQLGAPPPFRG